MRTVTDTSNTVNWILGEHDLAAQDSGSTRVVATKEGAEFSRTLYKPWGEVRYQSDGTSPGALPTDYTFTGQYSHTDDFGLLFYVARWYDPLLGRFAQADTIVPGAGNPMAWDRYAYVSNIPVKYIDPTGHFEECPGYAYACGDEPVSDTDLYDPGFDDSLGGNEEPITNHCEPNTKNGCYNFDNGLCLPQIGCSGGDNYKEFWFEVNLPMLDDEILRILNPKIDLQKIDGISLVIDIGGIVGDIAKLLGPIGVTIWGVSELGEILSISKDWDDLEMGDPSGVVLTLGETITDGLKLIPNTGVVFNVFSIIQNVSQGIYFEYPE